MKIMVGLDDSAFAMDALKTAAAHAAKDKAELTVFCVYPQTFYADLLSAEMEDLRESVFRSAKALGEAGAEAAKELGAEVCVVLREGDSPANEIVDYAEKNEIGLIVLGHKSRKGLEKFLIGSVAAKVVSCAPCSVLVVR